MVEEAAVPGKTTDYGQATGIVCLVTENRENNYLKIRDLLSIALFNILGTHYLIHI